MVKLKDYHPPSLEAGDQCRAVVWRPEHMRRTGRGPTGFERYYLRDRCKRKAGPTGFCSQHARLRAEWGDQYIPDYLEKS